MNLIHSLSQAWRRSAAPAADHAGLNLQAAPAEPGWHRSEQSVMGTSIQVDLWSDDPTRATEAIAAVMAEMHRIDRAMSPHRPDSELSRINRDAGTAAVPLSAEMTGLIGRALEASRLTDGAFDISFAAVGQLFDYREGVAPTEAALQRGRQLIDHRQLHLDAAAGTLRFGQPGMRIDLGGFAKGHAVDNAVRILRELGIGHAMVAAGGDSCLLGDHRGRPWTIAVRDPRRPGEAVALLPLQDVSISTSGDYERFFERDGVRHHHLIDPRTGRSPRELRSVTVLAPDGLMAEALSKAVFVQGLARGMALIESLPEVDAVVVDAAGQLHYSSGLLSPRAGIPH